MTSSTTGTAFRLRGRCARDLMTPSPLMVFETDPLEVAGELLARYSAVPVVDLNRCVVGVLSRSDLARAYGGRGLLSAAPLTLEGLDGDPADSGLEWKPPARRVDQAMTPHVITATEDTPAAEVVRILAEKRIGRVFVIDAARHLVGVVSTTDVIARLDPG